MTGQTTAQDKRGVAIGGDISASTIITGDVLFQLFAQDPELARYIRAREFQTLVAERTRTFVGRDFVFQTINELLQEPEFPSGYIIISGEPGIGKTALLAQLVKTRGYIHHFNVASQNIRSVRDFLSNLCAQLIVRYELDHAFLPDRAIQDSGYLSQLLAEASSRQDRLPIVVLVDALDEAETTGLPPAANHLYLPPALPAGVFFVVTTREKADYQLVVDRCRDIYLRDDSPANLEDVQQYIHNFLVRHRDEMHARITHWGVDETEFVTVVTEKSQGNFMYLVHVLRDIRDGKLTADSVDDIRKLPQGLRAYYQRHWRSMRAQDVERFEEYYQPVVCILATVREPVTVTQVTEWTRLSPTRVKDVIDEWREFLNVDEPGQGPPVYRVYHTSFQDFLKDEVGLSQYHAAIAQTALSKINGW